MANRLIAALCWGLSVTAWPNAAADSGCISDVAAQTVAGGRLRVVAAERWPDPPEKGPNTWGLRVTGADGKPAGDARVTLRPFMEAHGHGTVPAKFEGREESPGLYRAGPFDLFMPGDWRVSVHILQHGRPAAEAVFHVCIGG